MWGFEQAPQQRDPPSLSDGLLVPGGLAAAPQGQSAATSHLNVLLLVCGQRGQTGDAVQQLYLSREDKGSAGVWINTNIIMCANMATCVRAKKTSARTEI